jgi:hypothetical protein
MSKKEEKKDTKKKKEVPIHLKIAIKFVVGALTRLMKSAGGKDPGLYRELVELATSILGELPPLSLVIEDEAISRGIEEVGHFFGQILSGEVEGVT